jgi:hypothetical protein
MKSGDAQLVLGGQDLRLNHRFRVLFFFAFVGDVMQIGILRRFTALIKRGLEGFFN